MTFKPGNSGNPNGRPKGVLSKRAQLVKLLEPRASELIEKMIELALEGDVHALRLCIERLIPKSQRDPIMVELPDEINTENAATLKKDILGAVFEGSLAIYDAERLIELIDIHAKKSASAVLTLGTKDPVEAARVYQQIMRGDR